MYLDLDRFKTVNDSLGHEVGTSLLVEFARRLSSAMRHSDTLSRQGGDEFVILQTGLKEPAQAGHLARKLLRLCSRALRGAGAGAQCVGDHRHRPVSR
jgi:diguanylate cyclase (GGDEF)-like protein